MLLSSFILAGCSPEVDPPRKVVPEPAPAQSAGTESVKIRWKDAAGKVILKLEPRDGDYKLADGADQPLGKVRVKATDRVTLKDADGQELWRVKLKDYGAEVEDPTGERLYKLKLEDDGVWKLRGPDDETLFKLKPRDYGYKVADAGGTTLTKVKRRDDKLVFEDEAGERLHELKGLTDTRAGMWLAIEELTLPQRAALCVFFLAIYSG